MHSPRFSAALIALGALAGALSLPAAPVRAQEPSAPAASRDGAFGLQVASVRVLRQAGQVELTFDEPSAVRLRGFSRRATGQEVDLVTGGRVVATLTLRDPIVGDSVVLTGPSGADDPGIGEVRVGDRVDLRLRD